MSAAVSIWSMTPDDLTALLSEPREAATALVPYVAPVTRGGNVVVFRPRRGRTYRGYDDFSPDFTAAKFAAMAAHGSHWWANPDVSRKARLPIAWVKWKGACSSGTCYRDVNMPAAEYWPSGELPIGPEYAAPVRASQFGKAPIKAPVVVDAPAWEWLADAAD